MRNRKSHKKAIYGFVVALENQPNEMIKISLEVVKNDFDINGAKLDEIIDIDLSEDEIHSGKSLSINDFIGVNFSNNTFTRTFEIQDIHCLKSSNKASFPVVLPECGRVNLAVIASVDFEGNISSGWSDATAELIHHPCINLIPYKTRVTDADSIIEVLKKIEQEKDIHVIAIAKGGVVGHEAFSNPRVCYHLNRIQDKAKYAGIGHHNSLYPRIFEYVTDKFNSPSDLNTFLVGKANELLLPKSKLGILKNKLRSFLPW